MGTSRSPCLPITQYSSLLLHIAHYDNIWLPMNPMHPMDLLAPLAIFVAPYASYSSNGSIWLQMPLYGSLWPSMPPMAPYCSQWPYMALYESQSKPMDAMLQIKFVLPYCLY